MSTPKLYVFSISHYCEKAKWALELCEVGYELIVLIPATYAKVIEPLGTTKPSLPILQLADGEVIQGSVGIVAWANSQNRKLLINDETNQLEHRVDGALGVHIRRWFYSEALLDSPKTVKPCFAYGAHWLDKITLNFAWPKTVPVMIKRMDLGAAQEIESKAIVERELDWLDQQLADGRRYLSGGALSNADVAAASLLAPIFGPMQHPLHSVFELPLRIATTSGAWQSRPVAKWVARLYADYR